MAMRLDRKIEQLENLVEARLNLCHATWNGIRCSLPKNHASSTPHRFPGEFFADFDLADNATAIPASARRHLAEPQLGRK
jgi:hypothetical protein